MGAPRAAYHDAPLVLIGARLDRNFRHNEQPEGTKLDQLWCVGDYGGTVRRRNSFLCICSFHKILSAVMDRHVGWAVPGPLYLQT